MNKNAKINFISFLNTQWNDSINYLIIAHSLLIQQLLECLNLKCQ